MIIEVYTLLDVFSKHPDDLNMNKLKCCQLNINEIWTDLELPGKKKDSLYYAQTTNNIFDTLKWAPNLLIQCIYEIEISFNTATQRNSSMSVIIWRCK